MLIAAVVVVVAVIGAIYLLIGLSQAKKRGYLDKLDSLEKLTNAAGMIVFWPIVAAGIEVHLK